MHMLNKVCTYADHRLTIQSQISLNIYTQRTSSHDLIQSDVESTCTKTTPT